MPLRAELTLRIVPMALAAAGLALALAPLAATHAAPAAPEGRASSTPAKQAKPKPGGGAKKGNPAAGKNGGKASSKASSKTSSKAVGKAGAKAARTKAGEVRDDDAPDAVTYGSRPEVQAFADEFAARQGLDAAWVRGQLAQARYIPSVARFIMPPPAGTSKNWGAYRARFVEPIRIRAGKAFWQANEVWLQQAEQRYGVPAEIVVGIIGVETIYGQQMGNFRVIDALATLSFDFPTGRRDRSAFFRDELSHFLQLCQEQGRDPLSLRGSFAGAMGMPQFMPSSLRKYAVDFDGDGRIDLHRDSADVIGSVAHYLAEFGWQRGLPTHYAVAAPVDVSDRAVLLAPDILPSFLPVDFTARGARLPTEAHDQGGKLALIELQNGDAAPTYVAGTTNFYAITRYNWSSYYAMAVIALGEAVKAAR